MLNTIIKCLLIVLLFSQIFVMMHLAYINYKRSKEDKAFWNKIHNEIDNSTKVYLDKLDKLEKENDKSEQDK